MFSAQSIVAVFKWMKMDMYLIVYKREDVTFQMTL
jgi:hypothetical protein